jgi:Domain of unknown function (DUF1840)
MLYEFRSRATGTVVMTADVAEPLLRAMGKEPTPSGIVTVAQLPEIIARLERARAQSTMEAPARTDHPSTQASTHPSTQASTKALTHLDPEMPEPPVSFGARAWPLLDLLQAAHAAGRDVVWGV